MTVDHVIMLALLVLLVAIIVDAATRMTRSRCWHEVSFSTTSFPDALPPHRSSLH